MSQKENELLDFEKNLHELEQIVEKLEGGNLELHSSLKLYQNGQLLATKCQRTLTNIEKELEPEPSTES